MSVFVKVNYAAVSVYLKENMKSKVKKVAQDIADAVDLGSVTDAKVSVLMTTTDRAHASITIMHPAAIAMEAKHGTLRKAAASQGFEVVDRKSAF